LLRELGIFGQHSHEKRIPESAFRLANDQIVLLLRHLWATDGSVFAGRSRSGRRTTRVFYATNSRLLADDVAALLLRLGIVGRITAQTSAGGHRPVFAVAISGAEDQLRFLDLVEPCGPRAASVAALRRALAGVRPNTNVDTLPAEVWAMVKEAMVGGGVSQRQMAALRGTSYGGGSHFGFAPSRATIADYAGKLASHEIATLVEDDLFWDRVVAVEPAGEEEVYDLTVPGPANWLADGVVSHNSGAIEQDADLVVFIYRDEYYNPETTDRPGEADLLIAKHRNGGLGDVPLVFQGQFTRFMNRTPEMA
jgi:replicative DNA helicase